MLNENKTGSLFKICFLYVRIDDIFILNVSNLINRLILSNLKAVHLVLQLFALLGRLNRKHGNRSDKDGVNFPIFWNSQTVLESRALPLSEWTRALDSLRRPALVHILCRRMEKCKNANKTALKKKKNGAPSLHSDVLRR